MMIVSRGKIAICGAIAACAVAFYAWLIVRDDLESKDETVPPPFPTVPENAKPILVVSGPLPATDRPQPAKPVVAADHLGRVLVISQDLASGFGSRLALWRSETHGKSWQQPLVLQRGPKESEFDGDPWLETDRRGRFYYVYISLATGHSSLMCRRSLNGGQVWTPSIEVAKNSDRPVLGVSPNGSYLVIAASMAKRSAKSPRALDGNDPQLAAKVAAAFRFYSGIFISRDYGRHWKRLRGPLRETHAIPFSVVVADDGRIAGTWVAESGSSQSLVCTTVDQGETWTETQLVSDLQPDRDHRFNGERFPVAAMDGNNNLHVAFIADKATRLLIRNGMDWDNWNEPIQLSNTNSDEVRMAAIASYGPMVHVIWMERLGKQWQSYYRGSANHGLSWSGPLKVSTPDPGSSLVSNDGFDIMSDDDQSSVTDDGSGTAHAVWAVKRRAPTDAGRVWHSEIRWPTVAPKSAAHSKSPAVIQPRVTQKSRG